MAAVSPVQGWIVGQGWDANGWDRAPGPRARSMRCSEGRSISIRWTCTPRGSTAPPSRPPGSDGTRPTRSAAGSSVTPPASRPALLLERAVELMAPHLPEPPPALLDAALREAQAEAHRLGITGIHNVEGDGALERLRATGRVGRAPAPRAVPSAGHLAPMRWCGAAIRSGAGSAWLRIGGVKLFLDGSLGSRTAWMLRALRGSGDRGMPHHVGEARPARAMRAAAAAGIASTVHAIGDAAVRRALDLMAPLPRVAMPAPDRALPVRPPGRPRPGRGRRDRRLDAARAPADRHPAGGAPLGRARPGRVRLRVPAAARHADGLRERRAGGVDRSARRIFAALERRSDAGGPAGGWRPEEKLSFDEAVRAYTVGAAHAAGAGDPGTLAPGHDADLVAWAFDPAVERGAGDAVASGLGPPHRGRRRGRDAAVTGRH